MLEVPRKSDLMTVVCEELAKSSSTRDREAEFCRKSFDSLISSLDFPRLDFSSPTRHAESNLALMEALRTVARLTLDLPFAASVAAQTAIAPELIGRFGSDAQRARLLPRIQDGRDLVAICNSEEGTGSNLKGTKSICGVAEDGSAALAAHKPIGTNAFNADKVLVSAWERRTGTNPTLEVYVVDATSARTYNVADSLGGFRTGNTGSLSIDALRIDLEASRLGTRGTGVAALKACFDFERLYLGVLVAGLLEGLEAVLLSRLSARPHLLEKQYAQEKAIGLTTVKAKLQALILAVTSRGFDRLSRSQVELSLIKWICADEALQAVQAASDLTGWSSLTTSDPLNKAQRDLAALRFFGGTVELQKMTIFSSLIHGGIRLD